MNSSRIISVDLKSRPYEIHVGSGLLLEPGWMARKLPKRQAALVTNDVIWPIYGVRLAERLSTLGVAVTPIVLPDGESEKSLNGLDSICRSLLENFCDRQTTVIALGGGVIGDMAGFAAATYQRGVPLVQIPTSLLAMVDSSVGGKTAINHSLGKNMIGAFHQPTLVVADIATLETLPDREFRSALAEAAKYGLIHDPAYLQWIERCIEPILRRDAQTLATLVARSCEIKANYVVHDEFESDPRGVRVQLNLGHTFGHAIESALGYGTWLHGEAVACGIVLAAKYAERLGLLQKIDVERIRHLLESFSLPVEPPPLDPLVVASYMRRDKKNADGKVRLVLLDGIGAAVLQNAESEDLQRFLRDHFSK